MVLAPGARTRGAEYLEAENAYTDAVLEGHEGPAGHTLFDEIKNRIQETDASAPSTPREHEAILQPHASLEYRIHCRRPAGPRPARPAGRGRLRPRLRSCILDERARRRTTSYRAARAPPLARPGRIAPTAPTARATRSSSSASGTRKFRRRPLTDLEAVDDTACRPTGARRSCLTAGPARPCGRTRSGAT